MNAGLSRFSSRSYLFGVVFCALMPVLAAPVSAQGFAVGAPFDETPQRTFTGTPTSWLAYKADLQRSGQAKVRLGAIPNLLWRHSTDGIAKANDTSPLVVGARGQRRVYFMVSRTLFCIDGDNGQELWRSEPLARPVVSPITLLSTDDGDLILAVTSSGQLNALRASDGRQAWQVSAAAPVQNVAPILINTAEGERIMLAMVNGKLAAFTTDGQLDTKWQMRLGSFASAPVATPALSADGLTFCIPTSDRKLYVVDIQEAKVALTISLRAAVYESPIILGDDIIVANGTAITSLQSRNGRSNWIFDVKSTVAGPAVHQSELGTTIFAGAKNGKVYAVDAASGAKLWEMDLRGTITSSPTVTDDMVLVGTGNGVLFGLSPDDGRILWAYRLHAERVVKKTVVDEDGIKQTEGEIPDSDEPIWDDVSTKTYGVTSPPVVLDGQIYLLGDNAALYSFGTAPFDAAPPEVSDARLSIPNSASRPSSQRLDLEKSLLIPGRSPVQLSAELIDVGSGVDPTTIRVLLNENALPMSAIDSYSDATGKLWVTLAEKTNAGPLGLDDGLYAVSIIARDYRGNEMNYAVNFLVDNTVSAPKAAPKTPKTPTTPVQPRPGGTINPRVNF